MKEFNNYIELKEYIADTFYPMAKSKLPKGLQEFYITSEGRQYSYNARKDVVYSHPRQSDHDSLLEAFEQIMAVLK